MFIISIITVSWYINRLLTPPSFFSFPSSRSRRICRIAVLLVILQRSWKSHLRMNGCVWKYFVSFRSISSFCQLGEVEPAFETFYFQLPKFIFQCLIGTKLDRFQFYFGSLSFGIYRYGFRTGSGKGEN